MTDTRTGKKEPYWIDVNRVIHSPRGNKLLHTFEMNDELNHLYNENARLQAIVDKLQRTADGVPVLPGMTVYGFDEYGDVCPIAISPGALMLDDAQAFEADDPVPDDAYCGNPSACYSTREAAENATRNPSPSSV